MRRFGQRLGLRTECLETYKRLHAAIWPEIASAIRAAGIRNYTIYYGAGDSGAGELFATFEYHGPEQEFETRMEALAAAPRMREWWDVMEPMQIPRGDRRPGEWWTTLEEVFHLE